MGFPGWGLTIHSSRRRFAARLNSVVRWRSKHQGDRMALVKCPHCSVETTDRQKNCYYCGRSLSERPVAPAPVTSETPRQEPAPTQRTSSRARSAYTTGMYWFLASLGLFASVYGAQVGSFLGLLEGAAVAFGLGLMIYMASLLSCMIISQVIGEHEALIPIVAIILVCLAIVGVTVNGVGKGGNDGCIDSGRYGEYSSCS